MDESLPDIVKDIDCVQETRQHSVRIEHNWSINNVFNLIQTKRPGDKIESEQFCYENKNSKETFYCNKCLQTCDCIKSNQSKTLSPNEINITYSSQLTLNTEMICNYFLANALWRLELNRSVVDSDYMSINALLSHSSDCNINNGFLPIICQSFEQSNSMQTNVILKLKIYLLNAEMNELFEKQTIEIKIDLKYFFDSLLASNQKNASTATSSTKYIEKYSQDKFCKTKNLLNWLNKRKSSDFCLLTEFKVYVNHHPHLETTNKPFNKTSLNKSSSVITAQNETVLIFNYKHAWVIKNWRHFLMQGSQTHTFMNESEITNMFAHSAADHSIKFGKFRSKLFSFINKNDQEFTDCTDTKVDNLLKNVKWKLQLYPNGYSQEFEQNLSLFVNFSQLTGELAQFSSQNKTKLNQNNSKRIEETFYDSNENKGLILLIKSPSSIQSAQTSAINDTNEDIMDSSEISTKCQETFVKASFQISIMDSNGKRVDKCQSEKQLFELFGSWGYKEYMTAKDLNDQKDKYLSDDFKTLNLNCKIILFYTETTKRTNLIDSDHSFTSRLATNSSCSSLLDPLTSDLNTHLMLSSSSSLTSSSSTSSIESNKRNKKQFLTRNLLRECNTLVYDLRRVFKQSEMCDAIIKSPISLDLVDTTEFKMFKVHKLILAVRSQVFEKMFHNEQKINSSPQYINIIDFDARTVEIFLNYLYSDRLEIPTNENDIDSNDLFIELFKIADKYSVHRLKQISESKLIKSINSESCIELLILAYLHNSSKLKLGCFKYLASNVNSIVTQSSWSHLEKNYPSLLAEAFRVLYFKQK